MRGRVICQHRWRQLGRQRKLIHKTTFLRELLEQMLLSASQADKGGDIRLPDVQASVYAPTPSAAKDEAAGSLPLLLDRFFGRLAECGQLNTILAAPETRLLTLTGPGGTGKTRLAVETGNALRPDYRRGVWFVPLRETKTASDAAIAICDAIRLPVQSGAAPIQQVIDAFATADDGDRVLLVLDNFEQLDADAGRYRPPVAAWGSYVAVHRDVTATPFPSRRARVCGHSLARSGQRCDRRS